MTRITDGENAPDLTEEQGDMVRLKEAADPSERTREPNQSSDNTDSLDVAGVSKSSGE